MKLPLKIFQILLFSITFFKGLNAQFELLKEIGNSSFGSTDIKVSGISQFCQGILSPDKKILYFSATNNGYDYNIWSTDGTSIGTKKISNVQDVRNTYFYKNGIFLKAAGLGDDLYFSKSEPVYFNPITFFTNKDIGIPYEIGKKYLIVGENKSVYKTDGTNSGSSEIFTFDKIYYNKIVTTSDSMGIIYSDAFNPDFEPLIYTSGSDSISSLKFYLKGFLNVSDIKYAFCVQDLIIMSVVENGFIKQYAFNTKTKKKSSFIYTKKLISSHVLSTGDYLILTASDVIKINPLTLTYEVLNENVNYFSSYHFDNDKLVFSASEYFGGEYSYYITDGTKQGTYILKGTSISDNDYNSKSLIFSNKLLFTKEYGSFFNPTTHLFSCNINDRSVDSIGIIREQISSLTTSHGLYNVNGKIIVSRYLNSNGHELYSAPSIVKTKNISFDNVKVKPSLANTELNVLSDVPIKELIVSNLEGNINIKYSDLPDRNNVNIDLLNFSSGNYFITVVTVNGDVITKKIVKI